MNVVLAVPLAATWGWGIGAGFCMLMMVVMMFAMMGHGRGGGGWMRWWPGRYAEPREEKETPLDVLERRFAEGEISVEDYSERREVLTGGARPGVGAGVPQRPAASGKE